MIKEPSHSLFCMRYEKEIRCLFFLIDERSHRWCLRYFFSTGCFYKNTRIISSAYLISVASIWCIVKIFAAASRQCGAQCVSNSKWKSFRHQTNLDAYSINGIDNISTWFSMVNGIANGHGNFIEWIGAIVREFECSGDCSEHFTESWIYFGPFYS